MLPQQSLMLKVAADAIADARWDERQALRTGVLIGIGLDLNTTNFHLRWSMAENARAWTNSLGLELNADELTSWTDDLKRASGPALTANKTMGSLGGLIASRIAREFKIGGPSFTVSCDETSGIQALAIAADWLRRGELDAVIVGAVDFAGDARTVFARHQLDAAASNPANDSAAAKKSRDQCAATACDGAVALLVKRLEDAERDGDKIYAIIGDLATGCKNGHEQISDDRAPVASADEIETIESDLGNAGAALGLASVAKAALCLDRRILPEEGTDSRPRFWMREPRGRPAASSGDCGQSGRKYRCRDSRRARTVANPNSTRCSAANQTGGIVRDRV